MITFQNMTDQEMLETAQNGEIPASLLAKSKNVIAIFTQDWCPDWHRTEKDFKSHQDYSEDILVYIAIYNTSIYSEQVMAFKEDVWKNGLIPYIRCYKNGTFLKDSNAMAFERIVKAFN